MLTRDPISATLPAAVGSRDAHAQTQEACLHCGQPVGASDAGAFCCFGCRAVHDALRSAGLDRFYALRGGPGEPVGEQLGPEGTMRWLEPLEQELSTDHAGPLRLRAQGVRCAACVWVFERVFADLPDAGQLLLNPTTGALEIRAGAGFPLREYVERLARFGYRLGPAAAEPTTAAAGDTLLLRLGVCVALALNAMLFAAASYFGLGEGPLFELLHSLGFGAAMLSVLVGGPVFFGSALGALRSGVAHLDVPIAAGITLATAAAVWSFVGGHHGAAYYDSLAAFVALMVAGRYLQERVVERNRAELLDDAGLESLRCQRERAGRLETVSYGELERDQVLLLAPGELLPVAGELLEHPASCSLDWIDGEPEPRSFEPGARLPAGAFNAGASAMRVRLLEDFSASALLPLVEPPPNRTRAVTRLQRFSTAYVIAVLALATAGFLGWWLLADVHSALSVATAVCVVTCPCAIGIAIPLTYQLVHARLRRHGLFVRDGSLLDRLRQVRHVAFDKTGTLTTGRVSIDEPEAIAGLAVEHRSALLALSTRSRHPRSVALRRLLTDDTELTHDPEVQVEEHPGRGLEARIGGQSYRLGRADFCGGEDATQPDAFAFGVDGRLLLTIETREVLRPDAARELRDLQEQGYGVTILSGDAGERVRATAVALGIAPGQAHGGLSPDDKAAYLREHDAQHTLMIGDGINDALAATTALASGTPAVERAFLPARTDFHFTSAGLAPIGAALQAARDTAAIVRGNLIVAIAYNVLAVGAALAGLMQPWVAAIVMPLSSILVVARTSTAITHRSRRWKF